MIPMTCAELDDHGAELALGVLHGTERARALAHLDTCAHCRMNVESLAATADALLELVPAVEPPLGFESRVAARLAVPTRRGLRRRWAVAAAAAAVVAAAATGTGLALSSGSAPPAVEASGAFMHGGTKVGRVMIEGGAHPWVFMNLDLPTTSGPVTCMLQERNGTSVMVGRFNVAAGYGTWDSPISIQPDQVTSARVVDAAGQVLATAAVTAAR